MKAIALVIVSSLLLIGCGSSEEAASAAPATPAATAPAPTQQAPATDGTAGVATPPISDASNGGVEEVAPGQAGTR
jgi:hypothetical protein